jgi:hypothetical protein
VGAVGGPSPPEKTWAETDPSFCEARQNRMHAVSTHLPEWRHVLRGLLHYHLGGPSLRTRKVMLELQGLSTPGHPAPAP